MLQGRNFSPPCMDASPGSRCNSGRAHLVPPGTSELSGPRAPGASGASCRIPEDQPLFIRCGGTSAHQQALVPTLRRGYAERGRAGIDCTVHWKPGPDHQCHPRGTRSPFSRRYPAFVSLNRRGAGRARGRGVVGSLVGSTPCRRPLTCRSVVCLRHHGSIFALAPQAPARTAAHQSQQPRASLRRSMVCCQFPGEQTYQRWAVRQAGTVRRPVRPTKERADRGRFSSGLHRIPRPLSTFSTSAKSLPLRECRAIDMISSR